jgi:hypothetical protein
MTIFLRILSDRDKESGLKIACKALRGNRQESRLFEVPSASFVNIPSYRFAYWAGESLIKAFQNMEGATSYGAKIKVGLQTSDDFRFVRVWWEVGDSSTKWIGFSKGGKYSKFFSDIYLVVNWQPGQKELWEIINPNLKKPKSNIWMLAETIDKFFFRGGITWPRRTKSRLSMRILPAGCIFSDKSPAIFSESKDDLYYFQGIYSSNPFYGLVETQLAAADDAQAGGVAHSFEAGLIEKTPIPIPSESAKQAIKQNVQLAWSLKRSLDTVHETSHAFLLPAGLRCRLGGYDPVAIDNQLADIQAKIDRVAFDLYGFNEVESAVQQPLAAIGAGIEPEVDEDDDTETILIDDKSSLLSWAVGVAFGRFDWRLATGERQMPTDPDPFDPLPAKSPGMLPDGAEPFHENSGILVDDQGHPHDLARLMEEVLGHIEAAVPDDVRRWLQREFFAFHLQCYSKSRRKAPIYWPLSTTSVNYTLWIYYPSLSSQTLYTAINDFVEPKLKQVGADVTVLRNKGVARTREDEKQFEVLQAFEVELIELRDTLLKLAPAYKPNHEDGVQNTAAVLWPLFRHKPWQKVLKDTWAKLGKGDYDWAHLAMNYWPERVREKCKTDKSLAIAHGMENLYVEPEVQPEKARGKKKAGGGE